MVGGRPIVVLCIALILCLPSFSQSASVGPIFSTYFGGSGSDAGLATATDSSGNVYVAGSTRSPSLPGSVGVLNGPGDMFVAKFDSAGQLLRSIRLGGNGYDDATGIALDKFGFIYVVGMTSSTDFPIVDGFQSTFGGGFFDGFIVKLDSSGNLVYSSYLGGSGGNESIQAVAVDASGNAYLVGRTDSPNFTARNAYQQGFGGGMADAFVTKINTQSTGMSSVAYSTYLGGMGFESGNAIVVDSLGNAYVTGGTDGWSFPTTPDAYQTYIGAGYFHAFVSKFDPYGLLKYSTVFGGSDHENGTGIAVDGSGVVYLTGETHSSDLPLAGTSIQTENKGLDVFVAKLDPGLAGRAGLLYSTYLGGEGLDAGAAIVLGSTGHLYITGRTSSMAFPVQNALQAGHCHNEEEDAFLSELDLTVPGSDGLRFSTYLGGCSVDSGVGLAIAPGERVAIVGYTVGLGSFPMVAPYQSLPAGSYDAFLALMRFDVEPPTITVPPDTVLNAENPAGASFTVAATATDLLDPNPIVFCSPESGSTFAVGITDVSCTASDVSGNQVTGSYSVTVVGASGQISALKYYVDRLNLSRGLTNSLETKLADALSGRLASSCSAMNDFSKQVIAQDGKGITTQDGEYLVNSAVRIQAVLGCR
jgi:hypothetical protein